MTLRGKKGNFPPRKQNLVGLFSTAFSQVDSLPEFVCIKELVESLLHPVLASGSDSDLNGTGQGYVQSLSQSSAMP